LYPLPFVYAEKGRPMGFVPLTTPRQRGYVTATPLPSFVDGEKTSWLRLRSPSEEAIETVQSWKAQPKRNFSAESLCVLIWGPKKNRLVLKCLGKYMMAGPTRRWMKMARKTKSSRHCSWRSQLCKFSVYNFTGKGTTIHTFHPFWRLTFQSDLCVVVKKQRWTDNLCRGPFGNQPKLPGCYSYRRQDVEIPVQRYPHQV